MRAQATVCKNGHPLAPPNLYLGTQRRFCKRLAQFVSWVRRECATCRKERDNGRCRGIRSDSQTALPFVT